MASAVSTPAMMSLEEYLRTPFKPDCDFVEGRIEERKVGEFPHSRIQAKLVSWFDGHEEDWSTLVLTEQRMQVSPAHFRVADLCLISRDAAFESITLTPPILCVEILSPEDRIAKAQEVLADYRAMGVRQSWLLDPLRRIAYTFDERGLQVVQTDRLELSGTPIHVVLSTLFAALDRISR